MDTRGAVNPPGQNPYIGPRPFLRNEKDKFFGREREARDLLSLVISERLVLFYAQSGAGKTSLINTCLVPGLEDKQFEVLPVGRVSGELLPGLQVENIFATNLMLALDMGENDPRRFTGLSLTQFLENLAYDGQGFYFRPPGEQVNAAVEQPSNQEAQATPSSEYQFLPRALIIDQFEELFTSHPEAWKKREDFLQQLADAMQADPYLWVVLSMREDHIAELDPYASILPGGLRARYYMQRMSVQAALEAVTQPVAKLRAFEPQAARRLVENLSRISAGRDERGKARFVPGEFIEPVQLQVVCYQLWEYLQAIPGEQITQDNLNQLARGQDLAVFVNQALADFYRDTLQKVLRQFRGRLSEKKLRDWFANQLITEAKTRGFVFMGEHTTAGIPNEIVQRMEGQLLRGESRAGGTWYELVHDRFIDPILQSNRDWLLAQQRRPRAIAIGVALFAVVIVLVLALTTSLFANQAQVAAAEAKAQGTSAEQNAAQATFAQATAVANATQAESAMSAAKTSRADVASLYQDQAAVTSTLAAFELASTSQAAENQLLQLQPSPVAITDIVPFNPTLTLRTIVPLLPTETPRPGNPTPSPTPDLLASSQAATASALISQLQDVKATQTALASPVRSLIIGQTAKQTPIRAIQLGNGTRNIVLVGGLHAGFAPATVSLAEDVADFYSNNLDQIPAGIKLHIITNASPDSPNAPGELRGRLNSQRVDINRNWDCDWKAKATWGRQSVSGGSAPFSELETQILREYFERTQPVGVVFWEARVAGGQASPGGCGLQSLFSESLSQIYARGSGYVDAPFEGYTVNGDATNWLDAQGIPAISVLLPDYTEADLRNNLGAVQLLLDSYR